MTIVYNPHELKIAFIFKWRGTIFPLVLSDPMFWFLMIVHVMLLIVRAVRGLRASSFASMFTPVRDKARQPELPATAETGDTLPVSPPCASHGHSTQMLAHTKERRSCLVWAGGGVLLRQPECS